MLLRVWSGWKSVVTSPHTGPAASAKSREPARPASPCHTDGSFSKARTRRPVPRRVTCGTTTTRLATAPDRPTQRVLPSPDGFPEIPGVTTPGREYASRRSAERSTQCQPRTRNRARARFSGCHTTGGGAASRRGFVSAGGTRLSRACSRRGRSAGATPLTSRDCFGAVRRAKLVGGRTRAAMSPGRVSCRLSFSDLLK